MNISKKFHNFQIPSSLPHLADEDIPQDPPRAHGQVKSHEAGDALGSQNIEVKYLGPDYWPIKISDIWVQISGT